MGRDTVFVVDIATGTVRTLAKTDSHPNTIDLSSDAKYLYVSNRGQNSPNGYNQYGPDYGSILIFDTKTGRAVDAIIGGNQTTGLDVSPDGKLLAFTDFQDARVQLYAIPSNEVLATSGGIRVLTYKPELLRKKK
jgi:DNA-binding beta-propeller fold protein YncE